MTILQLLASVILFVLIIYLKRRRQSALPLPPGPRRLPVIGNMFDVPSKFEWETYHKWSKELNSDIIHLDVAGTSTVILDTAEAATDLLEKRSSIYSSRPKAPMADEMMGWDFHLAFMPYGEQWRQHRRLMHDIFHPTAAKMFHPHELKAAHRLLRRLLNEPADDLLGNLRQMAGETIMSITYGLDVKSKDDPYISLAVAERAARPIFDSVIPGVFLVNIVPVLKYIPSWVPSAANEFKRQAEKWQKLSTEMINISFDAAKRIIESGEVMPSFASHSLAKMDENRDRAHQEHNIKCAAGTMYTAGSDTTVSVIASCILGLLTNPEALRKAQLEIDTVIGSHQLPSFDDQESLPYVTAIVKEALRWRDATPVAIPHFLEVEDEYKGYRLPAGSIVIPNAWAMLHDENVYPDPFEFKPDRFIKGGKLNPATKDPAHAAFGFGRRICPARYMAFSAIWIAIASIIAAFDISKAVDEHGKIIEPSHEYLSSIICMPLPFKFSIKPRSKQAEDLIHATAAN